MQNAAIEMHWLMVNHVSRLKKAEKPKMLVWRTEFGRGVFFLGKLNKPCGYWFCQKWLLIISKHPKKSSEWRYFILTPPTDHGTILRRSPLNISEFSQKFLLGWLRSRDGESYIRHKDLTIQDLSQRSCWKCLQKVTVGRAQHYFKQDSRGLRIEANMFTNAQGLQPLEPRSRWT